MKKRGFGAGKWNAPGGKVKKGESCMTSVVRETQEETGIVVKKPIKVAEIIFSFDTKLEWGQKVIGYSVEKWTGKICETEEMLPKWFAFDKIPYDKMWEDDKYWLPVVLEGKKVKGKFLFDKDTKIRSLTLKFYD